MSTEINHGINTRPSSRVLKPPGGGHSNIFAEPDAPQLRARPKYNQQNSSSLNACMNTVDPNEKIAHVSDDVPTTTTTPSSAIQCQAVESPMAPVENNSSNRNNSIEPRVNNITAAAPIQNNAGRNNNNGRVPPGGFSSGLW